MACVVVKYPNRGFSLVLHRHKVNRRAMASARAAPSSSSSSSPPPPLSPTVWAGFASTATPNVALESKVPSGSSMASFLQLCDIAFNVVDDMFGGEYNGKKVHDEDISFVLQRAHSVGVCAAVSIAGNIEEAHRSLALCRKYTTSELRLYSTIGVHPTRSAIFETDTHTDRILGELCELIESNRDVVVALGECGLDYDRLHFCDKERQQRGFKAQLSVASRLNLPLLLHDRNTEGDFLRLWDLHSNESLRGVVHSFTGTAEEMQSYVSRGLFIGINGCSLKTQEHCAVVREIPVDRLLIETDAPYCMIKPSHHCHSYVQSKFSSVKKEKFAKGLMVKDRCEPCQLVQVLEALATVRNEDPVTLAAQIRQNTMQLFPQLYS